MTTDDQFEKQIRVIVGRLGAAPDATELAIQRILAARRVEVAGVVRELVALATADNDPEWINLVVDVQEGKYGR